MKYDLEQRTLRFSKKLIRFSKKVRITSINRPMLVQLVRAGTSVGANYREANGASSRKDFIYKIYICRKECQETQYWIELMAEVVDGGLKEDLDWLSNEVDELVKIFVVISKKTKNKNVCKL